MFGACGILRAGSSATRTIASALTGGYNLTKTGTGTLNLTGANSYTGLTNFLAGVLNILNGTYSGAITHNSQTGALAIGGTAVVTGGINVAGATGVQCVVNISTAANSNAIGGTINLGYNVGTGNYGYNALLNLAANEQLADTAVIEMSSSGYATGNSACTVAMNGASQVVAGINALAMADYAFCLIENGSNTTASTLTFNVSSGQTFSMDQWGLAGPYPAGRSSAASSFNIQDGGSQPLNIVKTGLGTQFFDSGGSSTYSGTTTISQGTWGGVATVTSSAHTVAAGATLVAGSINGSTTGSRTDGLAGVYACGTLTFSSASSHLAIRSTGTALSKVAPTVITAAGGLIVDLLDPVTGTGLPQTFTIISNTGTLPTAIPTIGINNSGRTVVGGAPFWTVATGLQITLL